MSKKTKQDREAKLQRQMAAGFNKRLFYCPQCNRQRLLRPIDHVVSDATRKVKTNTDAEMYFFEDICDFCDQKNFEKYFKPLPKASPRQVAQMQELDKDSSLENLL